MSQDDPLTLAASMRALNVLGEEEIRSLARRHWAGDYGITGPIDVRANEYAQRHGGAIVSEHMTESNTRVIVSTNQEKGRTTVLLSEERQ